jgi:hypothetical protein
MCFSWTNSALIDFIGPAADFNSSQLLPQPIEKKAEARSNTARTEAQVPGYVIRIPSSNS